MSKERLQKVIDNFSESALIHFFRECGKFAEDKESLPQFISDKFTGFQRLGTIEFDDRKKLVLVTACSVIDLIERSGKKAQYNIAKKILKEFNIYDSGIFIYYDSDHRFRFSLIYSESDDIKIRFSNFRRFTYFISSDQTNNTFLKRVGDCEFSSLYIIKDAFSVEKVNKEFYKEIAKYYYRLTGKNGYKRELALPSVRKDENKKFEEFAVRLIGRIIFCWFLKYKKSAGGSPLIPREALSLSAVGNYTNYYHYILEPLFFEVMNKPVKDRKPLTIPQSDQIPFLNGGLFEPHDNDFYEASLINALKIPDSWFEDFFTVLEQYNFTIDENSTVDADVSVDPEMLGRIFENLLAEVVPETGETARKATGSYYTPRAIVDYMVEQSLKQYLLNKSVLAEDDINLLLSYEDYLLALTENEKQSIVRALKEIKIIDPACGSGAFPMGILHRMVLILEKIDPELDIWRKLYLNAYHPVMRTIIEDKLRKGNQYYIRKLTVIQDSIYGVDIQPIAVEIAKLRCFLSLIVDEVIIDEEESRGIESLPNLEFKFVAANTLIGLPPAASQSSFGIADTVDKLRKLREAYLRSFGAEKDQIEKEFRATQQKLFKESVAWALTDAQVKQLTEWDPFSYASCGWFDPGWMFGIKDGFDIVIANPPYVDSETMVKEQPILREEYRKIYSTTKGNWDLYIPFLELGYILLSDNGVACFITPNKWYAIGYGQEIRNKLVSNINRIANCNLVKVFEAGNSPVITIFGKNNSTKEIIIDRFDNNYTIEESFRAGTKYLEKNLSFTLSDRLSIVLKIRNQSHTICDYYGVENPCSVSEAYELKKIIIDLPKDEKPDQLYFRFVNTGTIDRFLSLWGTKNTTYLKSKYQRPVINRTIFQDNFPKRYKQLHRPKLIISGMRHFESFFDETGGYIAGKSTEILIQKSELSLKVALCLLNSKLISFYIKQAYNVLGIDGGINFTTDLIEDLPVPQLKNNQLKMFIDLVDKILAVTKNADYFSIPDKQAQVKEYEHQIDQLVCEIYRLTPEEIAVVEEYRQEKKNDRLSCEVAEDS